MADLNAVVRLAAELMITHHGDDAARVAREAAELANESGDLSSTDAWREVAHAIDALQTA
jgi:hypothetical protein